MITNQFVGQALHAATARGAVIVFGYDVYGNPNMGVMKGDQWDEVATGVLCTLTYACDGDVATAYEVLRETARGARKTLNIDAVSEGEFIKGD
jgi:hypothetical protein